MPKLGVIADDFTGATDLASALVQRGFRSVVLTAMPAHDEMADLRTSAIDAVVIALKSRTAPAAQAIVDSREALAALMAMGCERFYFKYCSTFDSTPEGNIGPVIDALLDDLAVALRDAPAVDRTVVVPAFPATGRTVHQGNLFVHDQLLAESHMSRHPLTPMHDSNVVRLLALQARRSVGLVGHDVVRAGAAAVRCAVDDPANARRLLVVDAATDEDLQAVASGTAHLPLVTGASGLALGMSRPRPTELDMARTISVAAGPRAVLSGSASQATRGQVAHGRSRMPSRRLDIGALRTDFETTVDELTAWAASCWREEPERPVMVYSVDEDESMDFSTGPDHANLTAAAAMIEQALGACARRFVAAGARQLIVAGGETSGAVVSALGARRLTMGPVITPGVCWAHATCSAVRNVDVNIALKSGNFGSVDITTSAWKELV